MLGHQKTGFLIPITQRDCEIIHHSAKKHRHSSMDAGIQSQGERSEGFETGYCTIIIYNHAVTIRGTGFASRSTALASLPESRV